MKVKPNTKICNLKSVQQNTWFRRPKLLVLQDFRIGSASLQQQRPDHKPVLFQAKVCVARSSFSCQNFFLSSEHFVGGK